MVAESGPISAAHVAKNLGLTPAAVRRHLDNLEQAGVIEVKLVTSEHSKAGRPARRYVLSAQGQTALGDDYLGIAKSALRALTQSNPDAIKDFARGRATAFEEKVRDRIQAEDSVEAKAAALSAALREEGFVSSVSSITSPAAGATNLLGAAQLCQGHCPVQGLAEEFPEFCEAESEMFARLLGVDIRRLSTLATGSHVCTTHIPLARDAQKPHIEGAR